MSRLDTKALRSVILVLDSGLSLIDEDMFIFLGGYGEVGRLLMTSYVTSFEQSDEVTYYKTKMFVKFVAQTLLIANTIEYDDDYYAVIDAIADASTPGELWRILVDNSLVGQEAEHSALETLLKEELKCTE